MQSQFYPSSSCAEILSASSAPRSLFVERVLRRLDFLWRTKVFALIIIGHLLINLGYLLPKCLSGYFICTDAHTYAHAAQNAWRGIGVYPLFPTGDLLTPQGQPLPFLYSPFFVALVRPLGAMSLDNIVRVFHLLSFLSFWAFAAILAWIVNRKLTWRGVLGAGYLSLLTPGMYFNLLSGQIETFLLVLFSLAMMGWAPGILLAFCALIKPFSLWPLFIWALREPRRILVPAGITILIGIVIGASVYGLAGYQQWLAYVPRRISELLFGNLNPSLALLPLRLLGFTKLPLWGHAFLLGMFLFFPGLVAWLMRKRPVAIQASWTAATALLFAPFSHYYYLPALLVPMALELRQILAQMSEASFCTPGSESAPAQKKN